MRVVDLTIYGEPAPQGSKRYLGNGRFIEASKKLAPWRAAVALAVRQLGDVDPFTGPVLVQAVFFLPRPKTIRRLWPTVPPDTDKLLRALGDGLSVDSNILADDSLIVRWEAEKRYADEHPPGASVRIIEVEEVPLVVGS